MRARVCVWQCQPPHLLNYCKCILWEDPLVLCQPKLPVQAVKRHIHITCIPTELSETNQCERVVWCHSIKCTNTLATWYTQETNKDMYCPFWGLIDESAAYRRWKGGGGSGGEGCRYRSKSEGRGAYSRRTLNDCALIGRGGFFVLILSAPLACWNIVPVVWRWLWLLHSHV